MTSRLSIVAVLLTFSATGAYSQEHALDSGSLQVGGAASFTSVGGDDYDGRATVIAINPRVHYFIAERFALGADVVFSYAKSAGDFSSRSVGIGPSATYYFGAAGAAVHPYVSGRAMISSRRSSTPAGDMEGSLRTGSVAAGVLAMLGRSVGLTTEVFYLVERHESNSENSDFNTIGLSVGIAAFLF